MHFQSLEKCGYSHQNTCIDKLCSTVFFENYIKIEIPFNYNKMDVIVGQ